MENADRSAPSATQVPSLDEIIQMARRLTDGSTYGMLCTVDLQGAPRARWMGSVVLENFDRLMALTASTSRKIGEIKNHPQVQWVFTSADFNYVVSFHGRASVFDHVEEVKRNWSLVPDKSHAYFLHGSMKGLGVAVIETRLETMEFGVPKDNVHICLDVAKIREHLAAGSRIF
jgi:general stress protein 26